MLKNCLFGAIKVTKPGDTTDTDKYIYSGYGLGFDSTSQFSHPPGGVNSSNSVYSTHKTQNILTLGHGITQNVNNTTIYAEKMCSPSFSAENKILCLRLHYNGDNSYLFVNGKEVTKFKAKKPEIKANQLTLGSILIFQVVTLKIVNYMEMFITLVLTIVLFQMIKYLIFILI